MTILFAAFSTVLGLLGLCELPRPYHPVFNVARFALASRNRFFLCIKSSDPLFDHNKTCEFLETLEPGRYLKLRTNVVFLLLGLTFLTGCRQDMHDQPKFIPLRSSGFFTDGRSARPIPEGTVARGHLNDDAAYYTGPGTAHVLPNRHHRLPARIALAAAETRFQIEHPFWWVCASVAGCTYINANSLC